MLSEPLTRIGKELTRLYTRPRPKKLNVPSLNHVPLPKASNVNIEIDFFSAKNRKAGMKMVIIATLVDLPCDNVEVSLGETE